jgi:hypothetical protein
MESCMHKPQLKTVSQGQVSQLMALDESNIAELPQEFQTMHATRARQPQVQYFAAPATMAAAVPRQRQLGRR